MKKPLRLLAMVLLGAMLLSAMPIGAAALTLAAPRMNKQSATLYVGQTVKLKVLDAAKGAKVKWSSSPKSVASVTQKGVVTAKKAGKATVTAKVGTEKVRCKITVKKRTISLNKTAASVAVGAEVTLKATCKPAGAKVQWTSSSPKVATVTQKGVVTGVKPGRTTIKAKNGAAVKSCAVTVKAAEAAKPMTVTSSGISGGVILDKYGVRGPMDGNYMPTISLPLTVQNAPAGTVCYAVVMTDPDADNWLHWTAANIPDATIVENASVLWKSKMVQGKNDWGANAYGGPTPPETHTYVITVYALNAKLPLSNGFSLDEFNAAASGHVLRQVSLKATYTP